MQIMKTLFIQLVVCLFFFKATASNISGKVVDGKGQVLSHASIMIKDENMGTTANEKGVYSIKYTGKKCTIICQYVGYASAEKKVVLDKENVVVDFVLEEQQYKMQSVEVKSGGEDPAYAIIRNAIKTREEHLNEITKFSTDVYVKGQIQLRDFPDKLFGQTVDFEDGDSSKRKMIFLSETQAKYYVQDKNTRKVEVISTRVSGNSDGFGMASPQIVTFYNNIISVGRGLNPRGFISPIADNALRFYTFKYMGTFFEDGKEVNRIKVIPKRKYEPLFNGYINIIENEWRIYSTDLSCIKEQQLQFLDTLNIQQIYTAYNNKWIIKQQVLRPAGKFFGFDFFGSIVQVYSNFNTNPTFTKNTFDNTIVKFVDSSNKRSKAYWDSTRPIPLSEAEAKDYTKKDSIEIAQENPKYLDSLDKKNNKLSVASLLLWGKSFNNRKSKSSIYVEPLLLKGIQYNTVEGLVANLSVQYNKTYHNKSYLAINPNLRYGFSNKHFNPTLNLYFQPHTKYFTSINVKLGSTVFQFDNNNPSDFFDNTLSTLLWKRNYMKIYEAKFFRADFTKSLNNGFKIQGIINYQDRKPLENTTDYTWSKNKDLQFTSNAPLPYIPQMLAHKALSIRANFIWTPGAKYVEFPDRRVGVGSKYPTFIFSYTQGIKGALGSDVDYGKWGFSVGDKLNLKLGGRIDYRVKVAGFTYNNFSFAPDWHHVMGNQITSASEYLNSFQLMPFYAFNNTSKLYFQNHIEYHLNGLLSNKIPGFKKLNWFFIVSGNTFYDYEKKEGYYEVMFGIENILKIFRVDFVKAFESSKTANTTGIRFSIPFFGRNTR
jgi:hypothetical protein